MKNIFVKKVEGIKPEQLNMSIDYKGMSFMLCNIEEIVVSTLPDDRYCLFFSVFMRNDLFEFSVDEDCSFLVEAMVSEGFTVKFEQPSED